ncbi:hypothetical protein G7Y89_g3621 [Cudoniella acicularis]|uniref:Uncharacterized protein n=1 Tax=Cudoniella acicularis TaxID=354080 RepID=A0A8H4RT20_9HELO|nr:hypothetical protein G7Y89_g3621 [Cudoniella acicularis]
MRRSPECALSPACIDAFVSHLHQIFPDYPNDPLQCQQRADHTARHEALILGAFESAAGSRAESTNYAESTRPEPAPTAGAAKCPGSKGTSGAAKSSSSAGTSVESAEPANRETIFKYRNALRTIVGLKEKVEQLEGTLEELGGFEQEKEQLKERVQELEVKQEKEQLEERVVELEVVEEEKNQLEEKVEGCQTANPFMLFRNVSDSSKTTRQTPSTFSITVGMERYTKNGMIFTGQHKCRHLLYFPKTYIYRTSDSKWPKMPANLFQSLFEISKSDAILIHDCCASADTRVMQHSLFCGVTDLIATCGFYATAPSQKLLLTSLNLLLSSKNLSLFRGYSKASSPD